ncbi:L,D-transpeptidase [Bartonella sp. B41]
MLFRHAFLTLFLFSLVGCVSRQSDMSLVSSRQVRRVPGEIQALYGPVIDEPYPLPAVDLSTIDPKFWRQEVIYHTPYPPGTLVVDTQNFFLYLIGENDRALRYGIGVGKEGLAFEGTGIIERKRHWPRWAPTEAMMAREPERYGHLGKGMPPGPDNPLGARALYLFKNKQDTLFRIHGSNESWSIGRAISSGCIRLLNQDVIDLYDRVPIGSRVIVLQNDNENVSNGSASSALVQKSDSGIKNSSLSTASMSELF